MSDKRRLLLVEDDPTFRKCIKGLFGYKRF